MDRLREQAVSKGTSVEEVAGALLREATGGVAERRHRLDLLRQMEAIGAMSPPLSGVDLTALIREDRDR